MKKSKNRNVKSRWLFLWAGDFSFNSGPDSKELRGSKRLGSGDRPNVDLMRAW